MVVVMDGFLSFSSLFELGGRTAIEIGDDPDTREWAMHMMLVARCLERIGDNAVDIGEQTAFVVTGLFREFEDASHPELAPPHA
jgi:phosphate uptake regulator